MHKKEIPLELCISRLIIFSKKLGDLITKYETRPINALTYIQRTIETVISDALYQQIEDSNYIDTNTQTGFRKTSSCWQNLMVSTL